LPRTYQVKLVESAEGDFNEISDYIFVDSPQNARKVKQELRSAVRSLSVFPQRYKVHELNVDDSKTVRAMPVPPFVVFYRIIDSVNTVEILTVRHGARDRPPRFFGQ
jgi:plasmid stabilization system protein ParE